MVITEAATPEITIDRIRKEVRRLDRKLKPSDDAFKAAVVCLSALAIGSTRVADLARFTEYSTQEIGAWVHNLKRNGVFGGIGAKNGTIRANWFDDGAISFWMDVNVALGLMQRAK